MKKNKTNEPQPVLEKTSKGFRLFLPAVGVSRAGHGSFWVGLCFLVGVAIISACFLIFPHLGETHKGVYIPPSHQPMPWPARTGMAFFGVFSLAITFFGLSMGRRTAIIEVDADALSIAEKGLVSHRRSRWTRGELRAIQVGPSGFSVGRTKKTGRAGAAGKSIQQLHVYLQGGQRVRFLTGRDYKDLDRIAEQLRNALHLSSTDYDGR